MQALSLHDSAMQKMLRIFGADRGERLANEILGDLGIVVVATAGDLRRFAARLELHGTFETAVAAMLRVHAVISETKTS